jgi:hypothetical protein
MMDSSITNQRLRSKHGIHFKSGDLPSMVYSGAKTGTRGPV